MLESVARPATNSRKKSKKQHKQVKSSVLGCRPARPGGDSHKQGESLLVRCKRVSQQERWVGPQENLQQEGDVLPEVSEVPVLGTGK